MRIVIELDTEVGAPVAGVIRWDGLEDAAPFSGWIEMLRLLETAMSGIDGTPGQAIRRRSS